MSVLQWRFGYGATQQWKLCVCVCDAARISLLAFSLRMQTKKPINFSHFWVRCLGFLSVSLGLTCNVLSCLVFDFGQSAKQNENQFSSIKQVFFVFVQIIALHYECTRSFVASGAHFRSLKITEIAFKTQQQDARIYVLFFSLFGTEKETVQKNQRNDLSEAVALSCIGEHPIEHRFYPT